MTKARIFEQMENMNLSTEQLQNAIFNCFDTPILEELVEHLTDEGY